MGKVLPGEVVDKDLVRLQRRLEELSKEFGDIDWLATVGEESEFLRTILFDLLQDDPLAQRLLTTPEGKLRLVPTVMALHTRGYPLSTIADITGVPADKLGELLRLAYSISMVNDVRTVKLHLLNKLKDFQRVVWQNVSRNAKYAEVFIRALELEAALYGLETNMERDEAGRFVGKRVPLIQQIIVATGQDSDKRGEDIVDVSVGEHRSFEVITEEEAESF